MKHIIKKQTIDLILDRRDDLFRIQQLISEQYWHDVVPALERIFDKVSNERETLYIDKLEIDLGVLSNTDITGRKWTDQLLSEITGQLNEKLATARSGTSGIAKLQSASSGIFLQWLFYIENGYLHWNTGQADRDWRSRVLEALAGSGENIITLKKLLLTNPQMIKRIVQQHHEEFLIRLIEILTAQKHNKLQLILNELETLIIHYISISTGTSTFTRQALRKKLWENTLDFSAAKGREAGTAIIAENILQKYIRHPSSLRSTLKDISPGLHELTTVINAWERKTISSGDKHDKSAGEIEIPGPQEETETSVSDEKQSVDEEGVFVENAGLVILHPFLNTFFNRLLLVKNNIFSDLAGQQKALYLLHYLATGKTEAEEYELVIPKILCAYPLKKPVEKDIRISVKEIEEADQLLEVAIMQWEVLKNTSPSGLREGFLQRNGKLFSKNDQVYIQVEANSIDVLLDRLPWNLSIIKLPWMKQMIRVEWR
jgi:hypothetical protein